MLETRAYKLNKQRQPAVTAGMLLYYFYDRGKLSSCEVTEYQFDRLVKLDKKLYNNERRAEAHRVTYVKENGRTYYKKIDRKTTTVRCLTRNSTVHLKALWSKRR